MYLPVQMGHAIHPGIGYIGDDTGENISERNGNFCELTGLYWAAKNLDSDYIGIVHYRRYFASRLHRFERKKRRVIGHEELNAILATTNVVLPKERHYFIETNYTQYIHAHHEQDLRVTRAIIERKCPEYLPAYDTYMSKTHGHHFNMFVMKKELLQHYCTWLFDILFELEKELDISSYSTNDKRVFGFVSERLLDAWLITFVVIVLCPLSFKIRMTLFRVLSSSRKHPVCVFLARLKNSAIAPSSTSYPSR